MVSTILAMLLFAFQAALAGSGPVWQSEDAALDRLLGVICTKAGRTTSPAPIDQQNDHGLCCTLGCTMAGAPGAAPLPDAVAVAAPVETVLAITDRPRDAAPLIRIALRPFDARGPPVSTI